MGTPTIKVAEGRFEGYTSIRPHSIRAEYDALKDELALTIDGVRRQFDLKVFGLSKSPLVIFHRKDFGFIEHPIRDDLVSDKSVIRKLIYEVVGREIRIWL